MNKRHISFVASLFTLLFLFGAVISDAAADSLTIPNRQPWNHVNGPCDPSLDGAVFALVGTGCGGTGTSFDTAEIFSPVVIKDIASAAAPCPGITNGNTCYRLWYSGTDTIPNGRPRIGYAVSPDGLTWTRIVGTETGGSVFDEGTPGSFDQQGVTYFSIMKDGGLFHMWYTGVTDSSSLFSAGIGYATSTDGQTWTRVTGPFPGGQVLVASGTPGMFDRDDAYVPNVMKDVATATAPCAGVPLGNVCYRMWYEGARDNGGYAFFIGYATSPDGLNWTKVAGTETEGATLGRTISPAFDDNSVGISIVVKDGDLFRMWYEAKDFSGVYTIGHVVSTDGSNWVRPVPNEPVYDGADDPATIFIPDNVWSHWVIKDGARYKMWYTLGTRYDAQRFAYASLVPGDPMIISRNAAAAPTYTLTFTTNDLIPADGYILITLPPEINFAGVTAGGLTGFQPGATLVKDDYAVTDAAAANVARGALLVRLAVDEPPGVKTATFTLPATVSTETMVLVQTFDVREVLEYGLVDLLSGTTALQLSQLGTTTQDRRILAVILVVLGMFTILYLRQYAGKGRFKTQDLPG